MNASARGFRAPAPHHGRSWPGRLLFLAALAGFACCTACTASPPPRKVFVLGVDGLDPKLLQQYMDRGLLPNFKRLIARGEFKPLQTSMPPLSPVAWSTFITGMDPGGHGVFDFFSRDPATMLPARAETRVRPPRTISLGGCRVLPIGGGPENLRTGVAFWQLLEQHGVPTTVFHMPANFPPVKSPGHALSGMGTPDVRGTPGTFSFYTDRYVPHAESIIGGEIHPIRVTDGHFSAKLAGPLDPFSDQNREQCARQLEIGFDVYVDPTAPVATIRVQGQELVLRQGEWSDWVRVEFKALPLFASASAIGRFYLKKVRPEFELYVTPLQINPAAPGAMPLSTPASWSRELCDELGYFYTQELPEGAHALSGGILNGHEFWQHSQFVYAEQRRAFDRLLADFRGGLLFFYFSTVDQTCHMLWNYMDRNHPAFVADELLAGGIEHVYREMDEVVGRALEVLPDDATIVVLSDHGFGPFYWQVNLNSWLAEKGYVTLVNPSRREQSKWFMNVDWRRTTAYAVGLNGVYVNLRGREKFGIVEPGEERDLVLQRLEHDLLEMVDPRNGNHPVTLVVNSRRDLHGPLSASGPDLTVGYGPGYRCSWRNPLGEFPKAIFLDNKEPWSGDHAGDRRLVPGVLIANRPITLDQPSLYDVTVAILDEYGVAKPANMIGRDCLGSSAAHSARARR